MATLTFSLSPTCAGTNHYEVTVLLNGVPRATLQIQHSDLIIPLTNPEKKQWLYDLIRIVAEEKTDLSVANIRSLLSTASITLEI